jgi:ankyrin repeat protein
MRTTAWLLALAVGLSFCVVPAAATPLIDAIKNADKAGVQALIAKGANVNEKQDGLSPLGVSLGAKAINLTDVANGPAGVKDRSADFDAIAKLLLDHGADANAPIQNGSVAELAPMFNALGMIPTPLNWAIWSLDSGSANLLVAHGADVNQNALGLLEFAAIAREGGDHPYTEQYYKALDTQTGGIAGLAIAKGARLIAVATSKGVAHQQVALMGFAQTLCVDTVKLLIDKGADVNALVESGPSKLKLLKALEDTYAKENVARKDVGFSGEAWKIINSRQVGIMKMLIDHGAQE